MLAGLVRDEVQRHEGRVGDRVVEVPDDEGQRPGELLLGDPAGDVLHPDGLRRLVGDVVLGIALGPERRGEGEQVGVVALGQGGDRRRVDAAGQERADGHVGAHVLGDRVVEDGGDPVVEGLLGLGAGDRPGVEDRVEVAGLLQAAVLDGERAAGLDPREPGVHRLGFGDVLEDEVVLQRAGVHPCRAGELAQALGLGAERHAVRRRGGVERLDAEPVAGAEGPLPSGVPDDEGEHAAQPLHPVGPVVVVAGDDGLAVALGVEDGAVGGGQLGAQLEVVVDLAVEDHPVAVGVLGRAPAQRLAGVLDVDDRQAVEAQRRAVVVPDLGVVGAAVPLEGHPRPHLVDALGAQGVGGDERHETAHGMMPS